MTTRKTWEEFRSTGLAWFINTTLHLFGWALVFEIDENGKAIGCYPARCEFRGFDDATTEDGYKKVTAYLKDNISDLEKEANS